MHDRIATGRISAEEESPLWIDPEADFCTPEVRRVDGSSGKASGFPLIRLALGVFGISTFLTLLSVAAGWYPNAVRRVFHTRSGTVSAADVRICRTAVPGDACYQDVEWAMSVGITDHPDWYAKLCPNLSAKSAFEDFQSCVHHTNLATCPLPCENGESQVEDAIRPDADQKVVSDQDCNIAQRGDICFTNAVKAIVLGFKRLSEKYPGLSRTSSFEDVQAALHADRSSGCLKPCQCKTTKTGEDCFQQVSWVKEVGFQKHPSWYPGLDFSSPIEDIQLFLHRTGKKCPLPCSSLVPNDVERSDLDWLTSAETVAGSGDISKNGKATGEREFCETTVRGQPCYEDVFYGMQYGIHDHPEWFPGLTSDSTFEEFQEVLSRNEKFNCTKPCPCRTPSFNSPCDKEVKKALREGTEQHPNWFNDFKIRPRYEQVQSHLHAESRAICGRPCTPPIWGTPSLFCYSVFRSQGYEFELLRAQVKGKVGIFSCETYAVLSDQPVNVQGIDTLIIPPCENAGVSKDGTAANTWIFLKAWDTVWSDARWRSHDWVVKADPDAVILPNKLRNHLAPHTNKNVYMANCNAFSGPEWPRMYGSLEAISNEAMHVYFTDGTRCRKELPWQSWGEDLFIDTCLKMLGATKQFDPTLSGDKVCTGGTCGDGKYAVYHPYKSPESWFECHKAATR